MTPDQQKYLGITKLEREFKHELRALMGFQKPDGTYDWKMWTQFEDSVIESFPEKGVQFRGYKATIQTYGSEPPENAKVFKLPARKIISLHKHKPKGESK